jgi:hypothetical protein
MATSEPPTSPSTTSLRNSLTPAKCSISSAPPDAGALRCPAIGRPGMPAELAGIYVPLADNQGSFATGQIYVSSGGAGPP